MLNRLLPNLNYNNNIINTKINLNIITNLLNKYFTGLNILNSKPIYNQIINNILTITVYYYSDDKNNNTLNNNSINILIKIIKLILNNNIKIKLNLIKLKYPYIDANILAKYIALNTNKYNFNTINKLLSVSISIIKSIINVNNKDNNPVYNIGVKIIINGRLMTEPDRPRETIQSISLGSFKSSPQTYISKGSYNLNNNKGSLTVKVLLCQQVNL